MISIDNICITFFDGSIFKYLKIWEEDNDGDFDNDGDGDNGDKGDNIGDFGDFVVGERNLGFLENAMFLRRLQRL